LSGWRVAVRTGTPGPQLLRDTDDTE
jgi:hypothetical protein